MSSAPPLSRAPLEAAFDHAALFEEGLDYVRRLSERVWTDHNVHDPGITTLELLCYALTDLANRATLPVQDLLASSVGAERPDALHPPHEALPSAPLTVADYRRLLIDLEGVKNAWLIPAARTFYADAVEGEVRSAERGLKGEEPQALGGLFEVLLDLEPESGQAASPGPVEAAQAALAANRNLCMDFVGARLVQEQRFNLCCEMELHVDAELSQVRAELLHAVQRYLAPPVPKRSLLELLERPRPSGARRTLAEVLTGPLPKRGFLADEDLQAAELRTELRLSDVIRVLQSHPKVRAIGELRFNPTDATEPLEDRWVIPVKAGHVPVLNVAGSRMVFRKRGMALTADEDEVRATLKELEEAAASRGAPFDPASLEPPRGRALPVSTYESIANHLPAAYGVGDAGLPAHASARRQALAKQLSGYLLHFDQVMADYLAHLGHVAELFSVDPALRQTVFHQAVRSLIALDELTPTAAWDPDQSLPRDTVAEAAHRARFLDHLVARFGEQFHEYAAVMRSAFGVSSGQLLRDRCALLRDLPTLGARRGQGWDRTLTGPQAQWDSQNVSGFQRRVARLLGVRNPGRRDLSELDVEVYAELDLTPGDEPRWRVRRHSTGKILLSSPQKYASDDAAKREMREAIRRAREEAAYSAHETVDGRHYFNIVTPDGEIIGRRIEYFKSKRALETAMLETREVISDRYSEEGMYLVEAIMLRPEMAAGVPPDLLLESDQRDPSLHLPACPEAECEGCADLDPYSYRVHIILPAYAERFARPEFRGLVDRTLRDELPAHLMPRICWVGPAGMRRFERAYKAWLLLVSQPPPSEEELALHGGRVGWRSTLSELISALFALRNVYPTTQLFACDADESQPAFVLGRNALGSLGDDTGEPQ
ncbi:MAG: diguanylate cyclase [Alphaproteobacteria bacterium]|nr:diguanylate cyclase [Alphaproteobacteria bacterium]MCB9795346.1 diguanylate cyclase [Alphaproteobacteria bacterium]